MTMKAEIYQDEMGKEIIETDIPEDILDLAETWRENMIESIVETDEDLMMMFLEGEDHWRI